MEHDTLDAELPYCERRGVGIVIGAVFSSGITATGAVPGAKYNYADATPEVLDKVRRIEAVCRRHGVPLRPPRCSSPSATPRRLGDPGRIRPEQVRQNIEHMRHPIPADLWAELKRERLIREDAPVPPASVARRRHGPHHPRCRPARVAVAVRPGRGEGEAVALAQQVALLLDPSSSSPVTTRPASSPSWL